MVSLKAKQLLVKAAKIGEGEEEKISREEINSKIKQIKYLSGKKKIPKTTLRKEIVRLEKSLRGILILEKKFKNKVKNDNREIELLKRQIEELKQRLSIAGEEGLKKKVDKLFHLVGDLMAREETKREVNLDKVRMNLEKKSIVETPNEKIERMEKKIYLLKKSGNHAPKEIEVFEEKLNNLKEKLSPEGKEAVRHRMLFGPKGEEIAPLRIINRGGGKLGLAPPKKKGKK